MGSYCMESFDRKGGTYSPESGALYEVDCTCVKPNTVVGLKCSFCIVHAHTVALECPGSNPQCVSRQSPPQEAKKNNKPARVIPAASVAASILNNA